MPSYIAWLAGLVKLPTVRQSLHEERLFTEEQDRSLTQFEVRTPRVYSVCVLTGILQLFADLVFVANVHVC